MAYLPIQEHGLIGNMRTAALVGTDGTIDWLCLPRFDSPAVFASILDDKKGGHFKITPTLEGVTRKQFYWPDTNVLVTRFLCPDGVGQIVDFMPAGIPAGDPGHQWLIRQVRVVRGSMPFRMECRPAFDFARARHETKVDGPRARFQSPDLKLELAGSIPLRQEGDAAVAEFTLREDQGTSFVLRPVGSGTDLAGGMPDKEAEAYFHYTVDYWRRWISASTYTGRWREMVNRSALVLKLLTYEPTGAIVAAPTCSLPEYIGGARNWDYRYMWIRDAAFTVYALLRIGFTEEAAQFMSWLEARCRELNPDGSLNVMYGIDGRHLGEEEILDHLEGYRGSRPVRVGNGAANQLQLDIYGELMDSVYVFDKDISPISYDLWRHLRMLANWVCDNWTRPDEGIWEVRGGRRHFVYSKLMCWVALERALRIAHLRSFPADRARWETSRDQIYEQIMTEGWNRERQAFAQYYGSDSLDASILVMPLVQFLSPSDPRMLKTLEAINRSPSRGGLVSNSLVYRYDVARAPDGIPGDEGTFNICTFWLVEALVYGAARTDPERLREARLVFEQMLGYANHLGLYAEEIGLSGEALGNFPQAFTHLGLISAAFKLDRALARQERRT
ncbi:MAG TPA: glycoside hydrolase family 15 protein [Vicinamibacteria bacterium]|jgi:GH15 family glucan-1,4-alpha-glucosidase